MENKENKRIIDIARGVPCKEQLELSTPILEILDKNSNFKSLDDIETRNYGGLDGIYECKKLFSYITNSDPSNIFVCGNSSLNIIFNLISKSYSHGVNGNAPWSKLEEVKFLCVVPGYDRHFKILESFNIKMINIPFIDNENIDIDLINEYIQDETVKGLILVPIYSNPTGNTLSLDCLTRLATLSPKAKDFRIYYDNAYPIHFLYQYQEPIDFLSLCKKHNNEDIVYEVASTSKISFAGSGVSALIASKNNLEDFRKYISISLISYDKINQLRHARYFDSKEKLIEHMKKNADILRPKFDLVDSILTKNVKDVAKWNKPQGGYFITLEVEGIAKEVISRCLDMGLKLTEAGCAHPYHNDPNNSIIRIAPTCLDLKDLEIAIETLCLAINIEILKKEID